MEPSGHRAQVQPETVLQRRTLQDDIAQEAPMEPAEDKTQENAVEPDGGIALLLIVLFVLTVVSVLGM
jgi:hypothetical protein